MASNFQISLKHHLLLLLFYCRKIMLQKVFRPPNIEIWPSYGYTNGWPLLPHYILLMTTSLYHGHLLPTIWSFIRKIARQFFIITTPECEDCIDNPSPFLIIEHLFNSSHCSILTNYSSFLFNQVLSTSLNMLRSYYLSLLSTGATFQRQILLVFLRMKTL